MARVTGIGGIFLKSRDPHTLAAWYARHFHIHLNDYGGSDFLWSDDIPAGTGMTAWSLFSEETKYFGPERPGNPHSAMVNYRVDDLDALIDQLTAAGVTVDPRRQDYEYGRFAWLNDPEGNRVELWQPLKPPPPEK